MSRVPPGRHSRDFRTRKGSDDQKNCLSFPRSSLSAFLVSPLPPRSRAHSRVDWRRGPRHHAGRRSQIPRADERTREENRSHGIPRCRTSVRKRNRPLRLSPRGRGRRLGEDHRVPLGNAEELASRGIPYGHRLFRGMIKVVCCESAHRLLWLMRLSQEPKGFRAPLQLS